MSHHETHCTGNAKRECGMCESAQHKDIPQAIHDFKQRFKINTDIFSDEFDAHKVVWKGAIITLDEIKQHSDGCPNCTLTIIRGIGLNYLHDFKFEHQKEIAGWWTEKNKQVEWE